MQKKIQNIFFFLIIIFYYSFSQDEVKILQSNSLENHSINKQIFDMFCGNVIAEYKDHTLYCDTILISKDGRYIKASSKNFAKIIDSEGAKIQAKKIEFFKNDTIINFTKQVLFKKKRKEIHTDYLTYNPDKKIIYYKNGGKLIEEENIISSQNGLYHTKYEFGQFLKNVKIQTNSYLIESNNLDLDNKNDIIFFNERTTIKSDNTTIEGNKGFLEKNIESIQVWGNTIIRSKERIVYSDSIFINNKKETKLVGDVEIHEKENMKIYCQFFFEKDGYSEFKGNPKIKFSSQSSNILIEGENMEMNHNDSILSINNNSYISGDSIQGKSKQSTFDLKSEIICMINNPVIWTKKTQISGDTIYIYTKKEKLDSIYIPNNSFIISKNINNYYNQIKGKELQGKFNNEKLEKINIKGNTVLKYFEKNDEKTEIIGLNDIICSSISIYFKNNEINNISFKSKPSAIYTPQKLITKNLTHIEGALIRFDEKKY